MAIFADLMFILKIRSYSARSDFKSKSVHFSGQGSGASRQNSQNIPGSLPRNPRKQTLREGTNLSPPPHLHGTPPSRPAVPEPKKLIFVLIFVCQMEKHLNTARQMLPRDRFFPQLLHQCPYRRGYLQKTREGCGCFWGLFQEHIKISAPGKANLLRTLGPHCLGHCAHLLCGEIFRNQKFPPFRAFLMF